ncbi:hypothetical protein [Mesorhizobium sp. WSM3862]|uniref:hypothetical protein n=1 Tax=Mesorhizobium sp. WSM3862 TaxID=632858 RepID=UPI000BB00309|nr:hypothetical protein [Mesorhizobium sp. WSM3862]PBB94986.1 hypothetical protein CK224_29250 [Mesorhizobium sp. WSM3862]
MALVPKGRTFSKRLVVVCAALAWCALFYAIYAGQPTVAVAGFSFIAAVAGGYMGVGHMDLRALLTSLAANPGGGLPEPPPIQMQDPK